VARAVVTSSAFIASQSHGGFGGGSIGWWGFTGVGIPRKNLSWNIAAFPLLDLTAGLIGLHSSGNMAVGCPFRCFAKDYMLAISTALWRHSWAQSRLAWDIMWLRLWDAERCASFPTALHASVCAMLQASFHHLAPLGFGALFGGSVRQLACLTVESNVLRCSWTTTAMADHLKGMLSWLDSAVQWEGAYGRPEGNNITNSLIQESLCLSLVQYPDGVGGRRMFRLDVGWIVSDSAVWSDPSESSHDTSTAPSWADSIAGSFTRTRLMIEGCASLAFHVGR
jgi:hypothetical protein